MFVYSVGGFLKLDSIEYISEIYNFMQYSLLDTNVHGAFSYFDDKKKTFLFLVII